MIMHASLINNIVVQFCLTLEDVECNRAHCNAYHALLVAEETDCFSVQGEIAAVTELYFVFVFFDQIIIRNMLCMRECFFVYEDVMRHVSEQCFVMR